MHSAEGSKSVLAHTIVTAELTGNVISQVEVQFLILGEIIRVEVSGKSGQADRIETVARGRLALELLGAMGSLDDVEHVVHPVKDTERGPGRGDAQEEKGQDKELRKEGESEGSGAHLVRIG